jgi:hypothetical protein
MQPACGWAARSLVGHRDKDFVSGHLVDARCPATRVQFTIVPRTSNSMLERRYRLYCISQTLICPVRA